MKSSNHNKPDFFADIKTGPGLANHHGFGYGNCKSVDNAKSFEKAITENMTTNYEKLDNSMNVIKEVINHVVELPGDLHTKLHMLEVIFDLFYGGFLQVFQATIEFCNIKKDPKD